MRALVIDTAGPVVAVGGWDDDGCVGRLAARVGSGADAWLLPQVAALCERLGALDRVAVAVGPGAFTGIRVGVAVALGLALARGVPVAALSSLQVRAACARGHRRVLSLLDARKGKVYGGVYDTTHAVPALDGVERDLPLEALLESVSVEAAVGEGAAVYRALLEARGIPVVGDVEMPLAPDLAPMLRAAPLLDAGQVSLRYLREPDAKPSRV